MLQEITSSLPTWAELVQWVKNSMATNEFFATAGFFGFIGVLATKGKSSFLYVWNRIYRWIHYKATVEETSIIFDYIDRYLYEHHSKEFRNVLVDVSHEPDADGPANIKDKSSIKYMQLDDRIFIWRGFRLISIYNGREKLENAHSTYNMFLRRYTFSGIFSKSVINSLLEDILEYKKEKDRQDAKTKVKIFSNSGRNWIYTTFAEPKEFDLIVSKNKGSLLKSLKKFLGEEDRYKKRGILYKRGYLLYGPPGTGKTSLVLSLARELGVEIYMMNPAGVTDSELVELYKSVPKNSILLMEDADAVFNKDRSDADNKIKFRFSTLLQCMDGALSTHGMITIMTTNHIERLDDALIRNGRIDEKVLIDVSSAEDIATYLSMFYEKKVSYTILKEGVTSPMCDIQSICQSNETNIEGAIKEINSLTV